MRQTNRLESIHLHQIGIFDDIRIDFKPIESTEQDVKKAEIHLFTGANGCGKSTILYTISDIFREIFKLAFSLNRYHNKNSHVDFLFYGKAGIQSLKQLDNTNIYGNFSYLNIDPNKCFGYNDSWFSDLISYKNKTGDYNLEHQDQMGTFSFAVFAYSGQRTLKRIDLVDGIKAISASPFEDALSFDQSIRPQILLQWIANNRAQSALAKADGDFSAVAIYDQALARITQLIRDICDLEVEFRLERSPLAVKLRINNDNIPFDGLPDGLKSIISWVADLSLRLEAIPWEQEGDIFSQPIILLLDEIDIHLHPKWQRRILPAVQKLLPNAQIFASTHSPFVVGSVEDAWVYRLPDPKNGHTSGVIEGIHSGAGKSYQLILEEVFGLDEEFDVETEKLFDTFYQARDFTLKTQTAIDTLRTAAQALAARGEETRMVVTRELRQVSRLIGQEVSLA
jgi:hypothetical protein